MGTISEPLGFQKSRGDQEILGRVEIEKEPFGARQVAQLRESHSPRPDVSQQGPRRMFTDAD